MDGSKILELLFYAIPAIITGVIALVLWMGFYLLWRFLLIFKKSLLNSENL